MNLVSVDPGTKGAIFLVEDVTSETRPHRYWPMPMLGRGKHAYDIDTIVDILRSIDPLDILIIEKVTRPASIVRCMGIHEAIGAAIGADEVHTIRPQVWKKYFGLRRDKQDSIDLANSLIPGLELSKAQDGIAEAFLIGEFWRRQELSLA
jgi:hypothetical protein|tara:strand:- start:9906 stop:10355 length:450 start_codon:yes stop_codon:yes gene_type:complete